MEKNFVRKVTLFVAIAVIMLFVGMSFALIQKGKLTDQISKVLAASDMRSQVSQLVSLVTDTETGQRGYLLTGEDRYLEPYESARRELDDQLLEVLASANENAEIQKAVIALSKDITLKLAELAETIELRRTEGFDAAVAVVNTDEGQGLMESIRRQGNALIETEDSRLRNSLAQLEKDLTKNSRILIGTKLAALLAGIGAVTGLIFFNRSVIRQIRLMRLKERAEEADRAKSEFLATMSHEIRTPMNAILGFSELLSHSVQTPKDRQHVDAISSSGKVLLALINDVLDLSKIEAGKLEITPTAEDVRRFADSVQTLFSLRARDRGLDFKVEVDARVPDYLIFDALRVRQILVNLIGNALKFTREGGVVVTFLADELEGEQCSLKIIVKDTGQGVAIEEQEKIFERFYQISGNRSRDNGGTGLGLSISQRLAKLMDAKITLESTPGEGATFTLAFHSLPRATSASVSTIRVQEQSNFRVFTPSRILVVDDIELNRDLIRNQLADQGHELSEASNGIEALALARKDRPDLVLMDIRMPEMDGYQARQEMLADVHLKNVPVVAVTASSLLQTESRILREFDGFLRKPFDRSELHLTLAKFLETIPEGQQGKSDKHQPTRESKPLLPPSEIALPPEAKAELQLKIAIFIKEVKELQALLPVQESMIFASKLEACGDEYGVPELVASAQRIFEKADQFEVDQLEAALGNLDELLQRIQSSLSS